MFESQVLLAKYSSYKIGGAARYFYIARTVGQLEKAVVKAKNDGLKIFILGGGTNLLINDRGFDGAVIKPEINNLQVLNTTMRVGAGVSIAQLLNDSIAHSLSGLEWAGGLPGTLGGAIRGNAGAFGGEIKNVIKEVVSLDISGPSPRLVKRNNEECVFGYRDSVFKRSNGNDIIVEATMQFEKGDKSIIASAILDKIKYRQERQPLEYPNIGSIFKNIDLKKINKDQIQQFVSVIKTDPFPVIPTAFLIHQAGLKGVSYGGAMISTKHPNFIINTSQASAADIKKLIELIKFEVKRKFGVELEEEVQYV
ncbi:MAG: UDP-N-acetylmuramate dehydrogenase [bacterium]|nr:UDP-N-acetylmuramate dehydrogenase [bacterium]